MGMKISTMEETNFKDLAVAIRELNEKIDYDEYIGTDKETITLLITYLAEAVSELVERDDTFERQ